jgi:tetratricopeptide (TPR) repeat protein
MNIPDDIRQLSVLLPKVGIENEYVEKAIEYLLKDPSDKNRWGGIAVDYRDAGKFYAASIVFDAALVRFPESAIMWHSRGDLFRRWEKYECAQESFLHALEIDTNSIPPLLGLGLLYEQVELYERAVEWYTKYLAKRPDNAAIHNNLANCFVRLNRRGEAQTHYEESIRIDPKHENALFSYAAFLYENRHYDRALALIDRLLNYGWVGPADQAEMTLTQADKSSLQVLNLNEMWNLTLDEIRSKVGYRAADIGQLQQLIDESISQTFVSATNEQKTIFISYRRSSEEHIQWVRQFASDIITRGYEVVFDEFLVESHPGITVPDLVSRLATCNLFVPVLTNTYAKSVEPDGMYSGGVVGVGIDEDAWVFDEMRMAKYLVGLGRMRFLGFWHSGYMLPSPFCAENVVDIRRDELYIPALDLCFPNLK